MWIAKGLVCHCRRSRSVEQSPENRRRLFKGIPDIERGTQTSLPRVKLIKNSFLVVNEIICVNKTVHPSSHNNYLYIYIYI